MGNQSEKKAKNKDKAESIFKLESRESNHYIVDLINLFVFSEVNTYKKSRNQGREMCLH